MRIYTHVIFSVVNLGEKKKIFGESKIFLLFLKSWLHFIDSMDKVSKLKMSYNPSDAQDICVTMKTEAYSFALIPALVSSPIPTIETLTHVFEFNFVSIMDTLIMDEPTMFGESNNNLTGASLLRNKLMSLWVMFLPL